MFALAIDLETLSLKENAHILSIGAVLFNVSSGVMVDEFHMPIDIEQDQNGADVSKSTLKWWISEIEKGTPFPHGDGSPDYVLSMFESWVDGCRDQYNIPSKSLRVYQQGDRDSMWINSAWERIFGEKWTHWYYWNVFCSRTLVTHFGIENLPPELKSLEVGKAHDALEDAKFVAKRISYILGDD